MDNNLSKRAKEALNNRLKTSGNFSEEEIHSVSSYNHRLFSHDTELDEQSSLLLRNLCASSQINKTLFIKKSHRPLIGHIIFLAKKIITRVLNPLLKTQFEQIENFNHNAVWAIAKMYDNKPKKSS